MQADSAQAVATAGHWPGTPAPIGIVIPAYGHPRFLGEAILSACTQETDRPIRVVVVDDGCRFEETAATVANLAERFPGTLYYLRHKNTRLPGARNKGVKFLLALCPDLDAVFFLDADNRLEPYSIEAYRAVLGDDPKIGWAYPDIAFFGLSWGRDGFDIRETAPDYSVLKHLCGNISEAGSLVRADVFRAHVYYDETMRSGFEDWDFWLTALGAGFRGKRVKDAGFLYRRRAESMLADSRREEDQLLARMRAKHKALFAPDHIMRTLHAEAPTFALVRQGADHVVLTADPCVWGRLEPLADFGRRMMDCRRSPREYFFPEFILLGTPELFAWLEAAAEPFLRWFFWMLMHQNKPIAGFRFEAGRFPEIVPGTGGRHLVALRRWGSVRDVGGLTSGISTDVVRLPLAQVPALPVVNVAACLTPLYPGLGNGFGWLRHADRRYAGPDVRNLVSEMLAPLCAADPEVFPPLPWVRAEGERWFAFVATEADMTDGTFDPYLRWARAKGYRTLLIVEHDRDTVGPGLDAAHWPDTADMVVPMVLEGGARMSRVYLGRHVQSSMGQSGQLAMETLAFHFDHLMTSDRAVSLEAFGAARHRGVKTALLLSDSFVADAAHDPDAFARLLAYEHAIDAVLARETAALRPILSAQGVPGEKLKPIAEFCRAFPAADHRAPGPVVMSKPLNWVPAEGYVFIVTYGRSGSTLLQTLLQSFPGYFVRGENENALWQLYQAVDRLSDVRQRYDIRKPVPKHGPWYGADEIDVDAFAARLVDAFVAEVIRPPEDARVVGFKEIRYGELDADQLVAFLDFMRCHLAPARFIFNSRSWQDVARSGWWRDMDDAAVEDMVGRSDSVFAAYANAHPDSCCHVRYDDYVGDPAALGPVFELLEKPFDRAAVERHLGRPLKH